MIDLLVGCVLSIINNLFASFLEKKVGKDYLKKQKIRKEIDHCVEMIMDNLGTFFEQKLSVDEVQVISSELKATIESVEITSNFLAAYNYNPEIISCFLLKKRGLNPEIEKLSLTYSLERILCKLIESIVKIAPELFEEEGISRGNVQSEKNYSRCVINNFSRFNIRGISGVADVSAFSLETAFIPLRMVSIQEDVWKTRNNEANISIKKNSKEIIEVLSKDSKVIIIGEPGSGKTTLVSYIALNIYKEKFRRHLDPQKSYHPFVLPVREFDFSNLPTPRNLMRYCMPMLDNSDSETFVTELLNNDRAFILIDGLDECVLPPTKELHKKRPIHEQTEWDMIISWLQEFIATYPECRVVVTSRPIGYRPGIFSRFNEYKIQPLTDKEQAGFVNNWCKAAEYALIDINDQKSIDASDCRAEKKAEDLLRRIKRTPSIQALADTPLMLSILCVVHRYKGRTLPKRRITLLKECTNVLLWDWHKAKGLKESVIGDLDTDQLRGLVEPLAWKMLRENKKQVDRSVVEEIFQKQLSSISEPPERAIEVLSTISSRSGVLLEVSPNVYAFAHLLIRDYLAAEESVRHGTDILIDNIQNPSWKEMIPLAVGINKGNQETLILGLLQKKAIVLAGRALVTATHLDSNSLRDQVLNELEEQLKKGFDTDEVIMVLKEIGNTGVANICIRLINTLPLMSSLEAHKQIPKVKFEGIKERFEIFPEKLSNRCVLANNLSIALPWETLPCFSLVYDTEKNETTKSLSWRQGSLTFKKWGDNDEDLSMRLTYILEVADSLHCKILWETLKETIKNSQIMPERRLLALVIFAENATSSYLSDILYYLKELPHDIYPCTQIGLLNNLASRFNSSIPDEISAEIKKLWAEIMRHIENYGNTFIKLTPTEEWKPDISGKVYSIDDLQEKFKKIFNNKIEKEHPLSWLDQSEQLLNKQRKQINKARGGYVDKIKEVLKENDNTLYIKNINKIKVGVISTQGIDLSDAIPIANKFILIDSEKSEAVFYKQPEEEQDE